MKQTFYITTPIYYVNDVPHIGHVYTTIAADVLARYRRLQGSPVFFLTGTDEHGHKIEQAARQNNETPRQLSDRVVQRFQEAWKQANISHDDFIRTTEARHQKTVTALFEQIHAQGDIYKGEYQDWYCVPCETFLTELQLDQGLCPTCHRDVEQLTEESYFFKMSKYQARLLDHLKKNPDFIQPESRRNEVIRFVEGGLKDLSISRTGLKWGIPLPHDNRHVIYVWFDALVNYLTVAGYPDALDRQGLWPADLHVIGKDILRFHAVYWPTFLMSAGLPLPRKIFAHGWWTIDGEKMSKSKGNVVEPTVVIQEFGADAFRYFLLREVPFGLDGNYSTAALTSRFNNDLANDLGNLASRILSMIHQYTQGKIPPASSGSEELQAIIAMLPARIETAMNALAFHEALTGIWQLVEKTNQYIDHSAPWKLAREPSQRPQLESVLYHCAEALRILSLYLFPFMPETAEALATRLGLIPDQCFARGALLQGTQWGVLQPGLQTTKGEALFPRIQTPRPSPRTRKPGKE